MADNFGTLNETTTTEGGDLLLVRQGGIDYKQSRNTLLSGLLDMFVGLILPDSTAVVGRDMAFLADGSTYNRADYPKLWSKIQGTSIVVAQADKDTDPEINSAKYGDGDGTTTFTLPNYSLRPHLAAAGGFGAVGTTTEDQLQNITGSFRFGYSTSAGFVSISGSEGGSFFGTNSQGDRVLSTDSAVIGNNSNRSDQVNFDASLTARTGTYTEVNSSFVNYYIIHGELS